MNFRKFNFFIFKIYVLVTFLRAHSKGPRIKLIASARSPYIYTGNRSCAEFSTIFRTAVSSILNIWAVFSNVDKILLATITQPKVPQIIHNVLPLPNNSVIALSFESNMDKFGHEMFIGNISLDNTCNTFDTAINVNCTFESSILCGYIAEYLEHGYSWLKYRKSTSKRNGPQSDHTFENSSKLQPLIYLESYS